jgi:hypothetical protein
MNNAHGSVNEARRKLPRSPLRAPQSHFRSPLRALFPRSPSKYMYEVINGARKHNTTSNIAQLETLFPGKIYCIRTNETAFSEYVVQ